MRDYGKVSPQFWVGDTGKTIRALGTECQVVALYLMSSPHANMLGLYYLPIIFLSHETGIPLEGASKALESLSEAGFCSYDEESEVVWVHEMARFQIGESLKANDNRVAGVLNEIKKVPRNKHMQEWISRYADAFNLPKSAGKGSPLEAPPKPRAGARAGTRKNSTSAGADEYSPEFEQAFALFPKRKPSHNKTTAARAWEARMKQGEEAAVITEGVKRYAACIRSDGTEGTKYVMMAATFFGPGKHYLQPWEQDGAGSDDAWLREAI